MFNKKSLVLILVSVYILTFFYLLNDVQIEFTGVSLVKYKEFKLNCGSIYDILINNIQYTESNLRMNEVVCYNNAVFKILNAFFSIVFILVLLRFGISYINKKSNTEDLSDLLFILRRRNKRDI